MALESEALTTVLSGHNLLLLGAAGTGKTVLLKNIAQALRNDGKSVALTATTGIACCLYENASTIHKWSGVGDGRYGVSEIRQVIENNVQYADVRKKVKETEVLIIDECSMLSKRLFESLNEVCKIKDEKVPFGGIQLILAGDFTQLPPVPNQMHGDEGEFCFQSHLFNSVLPHRVFLRDVKRQTEPDLIKAIHEVANGIVTKDSELFLQSLSRPLPVESIKLFSRNEQVDEHNRNKILTFPGQLYEFKSEDEGEQKHLDRMLAPKTLWIKTGAPVILLRNLSDKLVNGLRGNVHEVNDKGPVVDFPSLNIKVPLEKLKFTVFSPARNTDVAVRLQFPIKLGFAITIHKSQGLTMESLEVDCRQIFKPGQLGVALGRAQTTKGLRVINFNAKRHVISQPANVMNFLNNTTSELQDDRSCCKPNHKRSRDLCGESSSHISVGEMLLIDEAAESYDELPDIEEDYDRDFDDAIRLISETQSETVVLPNDLNIQAILDNIHCKIVKTPMQYNTNRIVKEMDIVKYTQFCKLEYATLTRYVEELNVDPSKPVTSKLQTDLYSKVHTYQTSVEYRMNCLKLFENVKFTEDHLHVCFNTSNQIRTYLLQQKADLFPVGTRKISDRTCTNASEARVRYVGGYCVAKARFKYIEKKKSYMYKVDANSQRMYEESTLAVSVLDAIRVEEQAILATTAIPESLLDVTRRQYQHRSLTHIPDDVFRFFHKLTEICLKLLIDENMNKYGSNLFSEIQKEIRENSELFGIFENIVQTSLSTNEEFDEKDETCKEEMDTVVREIFNKIIKQFLMVMVNQFRKDVLESFCIQKKMAHRKQVRVSADKTEKSKVSKRKVTQVDRTLMDTQETPLKRSHVVDGQGPSCSSASASAVQVLVTEPVVNDSSGDEDDNEQCQVCHLTSQQSPSQTMWISCDKCQGWFHRKCAGLQHHLRWKKYQQENVSFHCTKCQ